MQLLRDEHCDKRQYNTSWYVWTLGGMHENILRRRQYASLIPSNQKNVWSKRRLWTIRWKEGRDIPLGSGEIIVYCKKVKVGFGDSREFLDN